MERFSYPSIAALLDEDANIMQLLELERYGERAMEAERLEDKSREAEQQSQAVNHG